MTVAGYRSIGVGFTFVQGRICECEMSVFRDQREMPETVMELFGLASVDHHIRLPDDTETGDLSATAQAVSAYRTLEHVRTGWCLYSHV